MSRPRILVADDDGDMRRWLRLVLDPFDAEIQEVDSGFELLAALADDGPFDLVITDEHMAMPNGSKVIAMARTAGAATPFIVVTSFATEALQASLRRLEGVTLISKPIDRCWLLDTAQAALLPWDDAVEHVRSRRLRARDAPACKVGDLAVPR